MPLHPLFAPALAQLTIKWDTIPAESKAKLTANFPTMEERTAFLDWNARLSMQDRRFLEPCQAAYSAVIGWDGLTDIEKVTVCMAAIEPLSKLAAAYGLIPGAVVR